MKHSQELIKVLEYLEENLDYKAIQEKKQDTLDVLEFKSDKCISNFGGGKPHQFERKSLKQGQDDMEVMLYNELVGVCGSIGNESHALPSIRANYGTGTLPSLYGAKSKYMDEFMLPWCEHLNEEQLNEIANGKEIDLSCGYGARIIDTYDYYDKVLSEYPNINQCVPFFHPDLQGAFDVTHLMMGDEIYYKIYDDPDYVTALLDSVTDTYIRYMKKVMPLLHTDLSSTDGEYNYHWGTIYSGVVTLRDDTGVTIGQEMYNKFSLDYHKKIIAELGSISVHYCGGDMVWLKDLVQTQGVRGMNFGKVPNLIYGEELLTIFNKLRGDKKVSTIAYPITKEELQKIDPAITAFNTYNLIG